MNSNKQIPPHLAVVADHDEARLVDAHLLRLKADVEGDLVARHHLDVQRPDLGKGEEDDGCVRRSV